MSAFPPPRFCVITWVLLGFLPTLSAIPDAQAQSSKPHARLIQFQGPVPSTSKPDRFIDTHFDLGKEWFWIYTPSEYDGKKAWGLIVYISPRDQMTEMIPQWDQVLSDKQLLFICPQGAGNSQSQRRREDLATLAALEMKKNYPIDPKRVYAAGLSGGARIAASLGFHESETFRGTIQCCGSDFYREVLQPSVTMSDLVRNDQRYGVVAADPEQVAKAKNSVRFALITGSGDFREHYIQDIYNQGFAADGFHAKLWDTFMGHDNCSAVILREAVAFVDGD